MAELRMYTDDTDTVVAASQADACAMWESHVGMPYEHGPEVWRELPMDKVLTVHHPDDEPPHTDTKTVAEWIGSAGRSYFGSTEY